MHRLRCGVIYTNAFAGHLAELHGKRTEAELGTVLSMEYVRLASSEKKGGEWWRIEWVPANRVPEDSRFLIGQVPVGLNKQSQRGLKHRCLDFADGAVLIR